MYLQDIFIVLICIFIVDFIVLSLLNKLQTSLKQSVASRDISKSQKDS